MVNDTDPGTGRQDVGRRYRSSNILTGLIFITIGALFFIDRQGWAWGWNLSFARLWPVLLIVMGVAQMLGASDGRAVDAATDTDPRRERIQRGRRTSGMWLLFIGGIMLMNQNHWMMLHQSWPLFIIAGGLSMLFGRDYSRRREK